MASASERRPTVSEIFTRFLIDTYWTDPLDNDFMRAFCESAELAAQHPTNDSSADIIPLITGSVAEFYIQPMLSCVGDFDLMYHCSTDLAIPAGYPPPTQLPAEFDSRVQVYDMVDSNFPGYVYLVSSHILTQCTEDDKYNAVRCERLAVSYAGLLVEHGDNRHGPAQVNEWSDEPLFYAVRVAGGHYSRDNVNSTRCLLWPPQAAAWPARRRNYGWPDSATVDRVVSNGCDVVDIPHRQCKRNPWFRHIQHRLSFSRAEILLLKSWMHQQQIIYHLLRVFLKNERFTDSANNSGGGILCNYHIKTLMLWACELKPRRQWTGDFNAIRISVKLLRTLAAWLTEESCSHYFVKNCNLFDMLDGSAQLTASKLMSVTQSWLLEWFIHNYLRRCAHLCPENVSRLFDDISTIPTRTLQIAVSAVVDWRSRIWPIVSCCNFARFQYAVKNCVSKLSLNVRSCLYWIKELPSVDHILPAYYTALTFLHICCKIIRNSLSDELLDILSTLCLLSNDARRCLSAHHSSVLSLRQAAVLMKVVATNSRSTVQLIEIELAKAYLYRALRCKDSDMDSVYCPVNVYLAVLNYTAGQYQTAIDHCTLVTMSQDHLHCSSYVVQGELIPKTDDTVDVVLGLAVFYQYIQTSALNLQQRTQNIGVFTTELFAHYLHIRCLSVQKYQSSSTGLIWRYQKYFSESTEMFICDVLLFRSANRTKYPAGCRMLSVVREYTEPVTASHLDTSKLVQLLQQSAVEHLTTFRELEAQRRRPWQVVVTTEFEALYAYKCGEYQRCLRLAADNVQKLIGDGRLQYSEVLYVCPELILLMDDELASLIGLTMIILPFGWTESCHESIRQLSLCLYLLVQCQIKLNYPVALLITTLDFIYDAYLHDWSISSTLDQLTLKLTKRKIKMSVGTSAFRYFLKQLAPRCLWSEPTVSQPK